MFLNKIIYGSLNSDLFLTSINLLKYFISSAIEVIYQNNNQKLVGNKGAEGSSSITNLATKFHTSIDNIIDIMRIWTKEDEDSGNKTSFILGQLEENP